jgi:DNA polymerase III epsilon subunit-like protein
MNRYIAFDCETTGLDEICNLLTITFIILDENLEYIDMLNLKLKQIGGYYIYPDALKINKINIVEHHKNSMDLIDCRKQLIKFVEKHKCNKKLIPIGHNINFDIRFIKSSGLLSEEEYNKYLSFNVIDTMIIAQFLKACNKLNSNQSISLINLCNKYNLYEDKKLEHTSEYDIKMTIKLLKHFKNIMNVNVINEQGDKNQGDKNQGDKNEEDKCEKIIKKRKVC